MQVRQFGARNGRMHRSKNPVAFVSPSSAEFCDLDGISDARENDHN
jgi:hypothetical protein